MYCPSIDQVWLAAVKLEWENNAFERARILLKKACDRAPTAKVWMKAALLERELKAPEAALKLIDTALPSYPTFSKLYMMAGQVCVCVRARVSVCVSVVLTCLASRVFLVVPKRCESFFYQVHCFHALVLCR